eukprot:gene33879-40992_t
MPPAGKGTKRKEGATEASSDSSQKKTKAEEKTEEKPKTPKEIHFDRLESVMARTGAKGYTLEQGVPDRDDDADDDEDDDDESKEDKRVYTAEEIGHLRHILITERREKLLTKYEKLVLKDQYGDSCLMFNTSFSYDVFDLVPKNVQRIMKMKTADEKYDNLMALTQALLRYDVWIHDNEDPETLSSIAKQLGNAWKKLMKLSDQELGIDPEFTRPGTEHLLEKFADAVATGYDHPEFIWK